MKKGIVVETRDGRAVVVTPDGTFHTVKVKEPALGEEVRFGLAPKRAAAVAACLVLLLFGAGMGAYVGLERDRPAVYAVVDINPAVEFTLAKSGRVLSVRPLNTSGCVALAGGPALTSDCGCAMRDYVDRVAGLGYFQMTAGAARPAVLITVAADDAAEAQRVRRILYRSAAEQLAAYRVRSYILTDVVTKEDADLCRESGISPGKLRLIRSLGLTLEEGERLSIRELNDSLMKKHAEEKRALEEKLAAMCDVREKLAVRYGVTPLGEEEKLAFFAEYEKWCESEEFRTQLQDLTVNWEREREAWERRAESIMASLAAAA